MAKNLCDKVSKIKNLRWQFRSIFRLFCRGVFNFFCRPCFHGEICKTKWRLFILLRVASILHPFVLQISSWKQCLQKKWSTPQRSQPKILQNSHLRFFIFETLWQRFLRHKLMLKIIISSIENCTNCFIKSWFLTLLCDEKSLWQSYKIKKI